IRVWELCGHNAARQRCRLEQAEFAQCRSSGRVRNQQTCDLARPPGAILPWKQLLPRVQPGNQAPAQVATANEPVRRPCAALASFDRIRRSRNEIDVRSLQFLTCRDAVRSAFLRKRRAPRAEVILPRSAT